MNAQAFPLFQLGDKRLLLVGASRGMGFAVARSVGLAGARLVIVGDEHHETGRAAASLQAEGIRVDALVCNLGSEVATAAMYHHARDVLGGLDGMALIAGAAPLEGGLLDWEEEEREAQQRLNLDYQMQLCALAVPELIRAGGGAIVLMGSLASVRGSRRLGLYGLNKAALVHLAKNIAVEFGRQGIRANAVSPGVIRTRFASPITADEQRAGPRKQRTPLQRFGEPEDVAGVVHMLLSDAGAFISGQNLIIDGGTTISDEG